MVTKIDSRRILVFLLFAFGIAWLTGLVIYLTGGIATSPTIASRITLAVVLLATGYMGAPAVAHLLTRLVTREGWSGLWLRPHFRRGWPYWLAAWFLPSLMTVVGAAIFFLIFPQYFDPTLSTLRASLANSPRLGHLSPWAVMIIELVAAVLISPVLNALATLGEEFGWRAYLLPKLMPLGGRKAALLIGVIWGVWHWPVILMGYEYGFNYPGFPWIGLLLFLWFTTCASIFQAWTVLRAKSVWPGVIGHAAINGFAAASIVVTTGHPNRLLGPVPVGIIGSLGFALVAAAIFFSPRALRES